MDVTAHQLRVFVAVARHGHFGRAAESLHLAASTVSENVATLERRIGQPLLRRNPRGVALTAAGAELVPLADQTLDAMDAVVRWAQQRRSAPRIRIGLMVSTPRFRTVMAEAARTMPEVEWEIRQVGFDGWLEALEKDEVDCAFVAEAGSVPPHLRAEPLWSEGCVLVVPEGHRLASRDAVEVSDFLDETIIAVHDPTGSHGWLRAITGNVRDLRLMAVAHTFEEVLELCGAGLGVNVAGASAPETFARPGVAFVPLHGVPDVTTYLCYSRRVPLPAVRAFGHLAHEVATRPE